MKLLRMIRVDLNKTIVNIGFVGAALLTAVLCFTSSPYSDNATSKSYSVLEAATSLDDKIIKSDLQLSSLKVFSGGLSGYVMMFLPIIVAFPFMVTFCAERTGGLMRFAITRTGRKRYYISKFISAFLTGGLAVMLGFALFGAIVYFLFPGFSTYEVSPELMEISFPNGLYYPTFIARQLFAAFLYGGISTLPAFFLSSFCTNPYLITCVPFMFVYIWETALEKIAANALESDNFELLSLTYDFYPNGITAVSYAYEFDDSLKRILAFNCSGAVLALIGFIVIMDLRRDKGA